MNIDIWVSPPEDRHHAKRLLRDAVAVMRQAPWTFSRLYLLHGLCLFCWAMLLVMPMKMGFNPQDTGMWNQLWGAFTSLSFVMGTGVVFILPILTIFAYQGCLQSHDKTPQAPLADVLSLAIRLGFRWTPKGVLAVFGFTMALSSAFTGPVERIMEESPWYLGFDMAASLTVLVPLAYLVSPVAFAGIYYEMRHGVDLRELANEDSFSGPSVITKGRDRLRWTMIWGHVFMIMLLSTMLSVNSVTGLAVWLIAGGTAFVINVALFIHCAEQIDGESLSDLADQSDTQALPAGAP